MKKGIFTVLTNEKLTDSVYKMTLAGDTSAIERPGQFVNIALDGLYLRRPISVCDYENGKLTLIYKVVGKGTEQMSTFTYGKQLDLLTGLGNGYFTYFSGEKPLLIGGGVGVQQVIGGLGGGTVGHPAPLQTALITFLHHILAELNQQVGQGVVVLLGVAAHVELGQDNLTVGLIAFGGGHVGLVGVVVVTHQIQRKFGVQRLVLVIGGHGARHVG